MVATRVLESQLGRSLPGDGATESTDSLINRVASVLAGVELLYGKSIDDVDTWRSRFAGLMTENLFWPSGRILNNAGSRQAQLASCFVLPLEDDFESILDTLALAARCYRTGGGTGFDFSPIRERGAPIASSEAAGASGPVSWLALFNAETATVMSGGKMRGANLGSLSVYHPDILEFIHCKDTVGTLSNFNILVAIDDRFMELLEADQRAELVSPRDRRVHDVVRARDIWHEIVTQAHRTGDPGLLFVDQINRHNVLRDHLGRIATTNPCGEQTLFPYEASNLGSINLRAMYDRSIGGIDWALLAETVDTAVRLLDNAIDACRYPDRRIHNLAHANRRLGLGVMGYADLLVSLDVPYDSEMAIAVSEKLASFIQTESWRASRALALEKGPFRNCAHSSLDGEFRNCAITSIAPTGTISMIAECSSGIEPRFAPVYRKFVIDEGGMQHADEDLIAEARASLGMTPSELLRRLGTDQRVATLGLPPGRSDRFRYAHDVSGAWHVKTLATWQRYTDNAVSKTVNLPTVASESDVSDVFESAWRQGCKGITLYRAGSRPVDLLSTQHDSYYTRNQSHFLTAARSGGAT